MSLVEIGKVVKSNRLNKKISAVELSKKSGLSRSYIYNIENYETDKRFIGMPTIDVLTKIANALEIDKNELIILSNKLPTEINNKVLEILRMKNDKTKEFLQFIN